MTIENYCPIDPNRKTKLQHCMSKKEKRTQSGCQPTVPLDRWQTIPKENCLLISQPDEMKYCRDFVPIVEDQTFQSKNQKLVGGPNPKTFVQPPIISPIAAWDHWGDNHVVPQGINDKTNFDMINSGYVSLQKPYLEIPKVPNCNYGVPIPEGQVRDGSVYRKHDCDRKYTHIETSKGSLELPKPTGCTTGGCTTDVIENYNRLYNGPSDTSIRHLEDEGKRWVNREGTAGDLVEWSYNPEQLINNHIPSNIPTGKCNTQTEFNEYNKNLFTNIIQPGVYSKTEVVEPIQSNIGISFQQQLQPVSYSNGDEKIYTIHDPRIIPNSPNLVVEPEKPDVHNIYDPRSHGYGTSYRSYVDPMSGQVRYMYDDIDAIRKPNYIVRSNIDHATWAHKYGPMDPNHVDGFNRHLVENKFLTDTIQNRTDIQERFNRKYNAQIGWQRRQNPIHTRGAFHELRR
jgi:hypothetical protein